MKINPIRYEQQGIAAGSIGALIQCCSTVISEGGFNPQGRPFTTNNGLPASNNVTNTETPANTTDAIIYRVRLFFSPSSDGKMLVIIVSFNMHQ